MDLTRRELLFGTAVAAAAIAACGGDDGGSTPIDGPPPNCLANGTRTIIQSNHGHTLEVPMADVAAGAARTYDITGSGDHSHMVTISAAQMSMLAANSSIQVTSTSGAAHTHTINVNCR